MCMAFTMKSLARAFLDCDSCVGILGITTIFSRIRLLTILGAHLAVFAINSFFESVVRGWSLHHFEDEACIFSDMRLRYLSAKQMSMVHGHLCLLVDCSLWLMSAISARSLDSALTSQAYDKHAKL